MPELLREQGGSPELFVGLHRKWLASKRKANVKKAEPRDRERTRPEETVKPPGPDRPNIVYCGYYVVVFKRPQRMMQISFLGYYKNCINSHIYDVYDDPDRKSTTNFFLSLSSPHIPDWLVVEGIRLNSSRNYLLITDHPWDLMQGVSSILNITPPDALFLPLCPALS